MSRKIDLAAGSLLVAGGLNWLSVALARFDLVAWATRSRKRPNVFARGVYGAVGGAAVYSLARQIASAATAKADSATGHVSDVMSDNPATVTSTTQVVEAAQLLQREDIGSVPVVDDGRLVGILTDRDIALRVIAEDRSTTGLTVGEIASRDLATVEPGESLDRALHLMAQRQVRRLPVIERDRLVGIVAQADIARRLPEAETGDMVEQISR
jgi:CBS domain-containing protein